MKKIVSFLKSWFNRFENFRHIPLLLSRLTISVVFIASGLSNLRHLDKTVILFSSLGIPYSHFLAPLTSWVELIFGFCILIGFATRIVAIPLVFILIVGIVTGKWHSLHGLYSLFETTEFLYIILLLWIISLGAGGYSIDSKLKAKYFRM